MSVNQSFTSSSSHKGTSADSHPGNYHLDLGSCLREGMELIKNHFAQSILAALISLASLFLVNLPYIILYILIYILPFLDLSYIDFILTPWGFTCFITLLILFGLFQMIFKAIIEAGTLYYFWRLRNLSPQQPSLKEIFTPFRHGFWRITGRTFLLAGLYGLIFAICAGIFAGIGALIGIAINASNNQLSNFIGLFGVIGAFVSLPIIYYFHISFIFSPLLILDRNMGALEALKYSRRVAKKQIWIVILIWVVLGIIALSGSMLCYVGLLVTYPFYYIGVAHLYDQMFRKTDRSF